MRYPDHNGQVPTSFAPTASPARGQNYLCLSTYLHTPPKQTALHFVASKSNLEVARLLIESKPPASARVRDKRGQYALHRAAAVGSVPMVNLLLKNKSPLNATDSSGYTALHHAVAEGHGM